MEMVNCPFLYKRLQSFSFSKLYLLQLREIFYDTYMSYGMKETLSQNKQ